jgi:hypothetical protein
MSGVGARRFVGGVLAAFVLAGGTLFGGIAPVAAEVPVPTKAPNPCSTEEWRNPSNWDRCVNGLPDVGADKINCVKAPTPATPDSGMAGWFASMPANELLTSGRPDLYTKYGYAGYDYTTYDIGCTPTVMHPDHKFENTMANGEFLLATSMIGASNSIREKAWVPDSMWGWADPVVETATQAIYDKVFTVFGGVTLAIVGLYLLWRSRQSDMSAAMTTAGWAILIMVAVTAVAKWPTTAANLADDTLTGSLSLVHQAVGPRDESIPSDECRNPDVAACKDNRPPALRASDTATEGLIYRNWLRGLLGSSDSETARKYGPILHDAKSFSWREAVDIRENPELRQQLIDRKAKTWMRVAEQIRAEDPEAYEYLQGTRGMDRIGAGFIAILAALFFALFDLTASLLVLLGFLIFRWAVIAAPVLGTVGIFRPASAGIRRLVNVVVAAVFNIVIFGTGAAVYLFAVSLIIQTESIPGWLQVVLILLTGMVGWILLRPYRRITQLGGKDPSKTITSIGGWHRLFFRDLKRAQAQETADGTASPRSPTVAVQTQRPEARDEDVAVAQPVQRPEESAPVPTRPPEYTPQWTEPNERDAPSYAIYRPTQREAPAQARRPESETVRR